MPECASIIILSYKKLDSLYEAIDSALLQDYENMELIISDDGSPNFDKEIVESYVREHKKDNIKHFLVLKNSNNQGTVKNINNAIKNSSGNYILPLSCDDCFFDEHVVSSVVARLKKSKNGVIACRRLLFRKESNVQRLVPSNHQRKKISKLDTPEKQHRAFAFGQFYDMASGSCTYYVRSHFDKEGYFNEKFRLLEDWPHFLEITRTCLIESAYDIVSIKYRDGGISTALPKQLVDDYLLMMKEEKTRLPLNAPLFYKRYIDFNISRFESKKIYTYLKYLDILFYRFLYKLSNR